MVDNILLDGEERGVGIFFSVPQPRIQPAGTSSALCLLHIFLGSWRLIVRHTPELTSLFVCSCLVVCFIYMRPAYSRLMNMHVCIYVLVCFLKILVFEQLQYRVTVACSHITAFMEIKTLHLVLDGLCDVWDRAKCEYWLIVASILLLTRRCYTVLKKVVLLSSLRRLHCSLCMVGVLEYILQLLPPWPWQHASATPESTFNCFVSHSTRVRIVLSTVTLSCCLLEFWNGIVL